MGETEILEIQNLSEDDLLSVYDMVVEHIQYLHNSIIDTTIVENEAEGEEEESAEEEIEDEQQSE